MRYRFDQVDHITDRQFLSRNVLAEFSASTAFDLIYSDSKLNGMRASLRHGPFANFDDMARRLFDTPYCNLSIKRQSLIASFERSTSPSRFQNLLLNAEEKEALKRFNAILP
jgi:hypothetical protein